MRSERVRVMFRNLPHVPVRQRHARLGGGGFRDLEGLLAARQGQLHWLDAEPWDQVLIEPYSVHLLSAEW